MCVLLLSSRLYSPDVCLFPAIIDSEIDEEFPGADMDRNLTCMTGCHVVDISIKSTCMTLNKYKIYMTG